MKIQKITKSVNETILLGESLSKQFNTGCVIALKGDLGVGKTAFTKGIARGLEISDTVVSPTFTLLREYEGRLSLKHIDAYRLENANADSLGLYDLMDDDSVVVIEWSEFIDSDVEFDLTVLIEELSENERSIIIEGEMNVYIDN